MLSKADEEQLQRLCGNDETLALTRKLVPLAKARTKQGSGHNLAELATGLPAICAYLASKQLNNNDVTPENARQASCLRTIDYNKALRTIRGVLEPELSSRKGKKEITYDALYEKYNVALPFSSFNELLRQAERELVQLNPHHKVDRPDVRCAVFFWASSTANVKEFPTLNEFVQDNSMLSKRIVPLVKVLNDKCHSLKIKLAEIVKNQSRPSSPSKLLLQPSTPRTPRRSPTKPLREPPTRESLKEQRQAQIVEPSLSKTTEDVEVSDVDMGPPETPTKKRKLESSPSASLSRKRLPSFPDVPSISHTTRSTSPTKSKNNSTPAFPSPLRRSARVVLQEEVDAAMDVDDNDEALASLNRSLEVDLANALANALANVEKDEDLRGDEHLVTRRFRPVYRDYKQWFARDARVLRAWRGAT